MKRKISTLLILLLAGVSISQYTLAQDIGTGVTWGTLSPSEPLLINEKFQGFTLFHTDANPDQGNSDNKIDAVSGEVVYGYKDLVKKVALIGSNDSAVTYTFTQCAFAPEWQAAYAFKNSASNSENVSNGFVEISRTYASTPPTVHGSFVVDLRNLSFVEVIQWSHSSTGGNKRGVLCEFSIDEGATWDTLRYQSGGAAYASSFTKDVTTREKTLNSYRCDPSAYGMTWEDGIWSNEKIMLRFGEAGGQTPRIHDLKVYGTYTPNSVPGIKNDEMKIYSANKKIIISRQAKVAVYNIAGKMVKSAENTNRIAMEGMPDGIYLVKAQSGSLMKTSKVIIK